MIPGIDLSRWQATTPPLAGCGFAFVKASEGRDYLDPLYARHTTAAKAAGIVRGAYHFGHRGIDPSIQARLLVAAAPDAQMYALDSEGTWAMSRSEINAFCDAVRAARPGVKVGLYASASGFPHGAGQDFDWIASWTATPPAKPWAFWQWTSAGSVPGYRGRVDLDWFDGTAAELDALAGIASQLTIAAGSRVMIARVTSAGCISGWDVQTWGSKPSSAPCRPVQTMRGCKSGAAPVALVTAGVFAGRHVRIGSGVAVGTINQGG